MDEQRLMREHKTTTAVVSLLFVTTLTRQAKKNCTVAEMIPWRNI